MIDNPDLARHHGRLFHRDHVPTAEILRLGGASSDETGYRITCSCSMVVEINYRHGQSPGYAWRLWYAHERRQCGRRPERARMHEERERQRQRSDLGRLP